MKKYKHLSATEREVLSILLAQKYSINQIAKIIHRSKSTISRELNRETSVFYNGIYLGESSQKRYLKRWKESHRRKRLKNSFIEEYVLTRLKRYWSPETISGRLKKFGISISHEAIYQYIYDGKRDLVEYLPRKHKARFNFNQYRKAKRNHIPNRIDIENRDENANLRKEFGHFEADCIISSRNSKSALLVIVDRKTRYTKIRKLTQKTSSQASLGIISALSRYSSSHLHSITYDNGCEFSRHEIVNKTLNIKSYFCKPYHSWEKGTVENINGLIRRFFPKRTNFDTITDREIQFVQDWINSRPMKILGFSTPAECFLQDVPLAS